MIISYLFERKYGKENVKNIKGYIQFLVGLGDAFIVFGLLALILFTVK